MMIHEGKGLKKYFWGLFSIWTVVITATITKYLFVVYFKNNSFLQISKLKLKLAKSEKCFFVTGGTMNILN